MKIDLTIVDKKFAISIEQCFLKSHKGVVETQKNLGLESNSLLVGSGEAFYLGKASFLTQVMGWGFDVDEKEIEDQIKAIEAFYLANGVEEAAIELSPFCGNSILEQLSQRNYRASEVTNISLLRLDNYCIPETLPVQIELSGKEDLTAWAKCIAEGFGCPEASSQFQIYASSEQMLVFQARDESTIIAGATMGIHSPFVDLGVTSTLPAFRGQGIQKSLLHKRLTYAKREGLEYAVVATEPGSISDLNVQKVGFHCAYTRIKFLKKLGN